MRLTKTLDIYIGDTKKPVTVYEVTPEDVLSVIDSTEDEIRERADELLPRCVTMTFDDMKKTAPSQLKLVWEAFTEVNAVFFSLVEKTGVMNEIIPDIGRAVLAEIRKDLGSSLPEQPSSSYSAGS